MEEIHERLRAELSARGITAAAAARTAGLPDSQGLRDTLNGRKRVTADLLALLLPLGIDALYVLTGQRSASAAPNTQPLARDEEILLDNYRNSPPDARAAIKATSDAFARSARGAKRDKAA